MANDPTTFATLKASLATRMIRDDLDDIIPEMIAEAERGFQRDILVPNREETTTLTAAASGAALPVDFWGVRTVYVDGASNTPLKQVTPDRLRELYSIPLSGTPRHFAIEFGVMLLGPSSDTAEISLTYIQTIPALSDSVTNNWLLLAYPDLYLRATLALLNEYIKDYQAADRENARAMAIVADINRAGGRYKHAGPLQASNPVAQVSRWAKA